MESIKISVEVSVNLSESTQDFIKSLFVATAPKAAVVVGAEPKAAGPTVTAASVEAKPEAKPAAPATPVEAKPAAPATPVEAKPEAKPVVEPTAPAVSIEDVRQELVKKVNAHREEIKAKLTEFGAPSVTKLDPSKYVDMYSFLTSL